MCIPKSLPLQTKYHKQPFCVTLTPCGDNHEVLVKADLNSTPDSEADTKSVTNRTPAEYHDAEASSPLRRLSPEYVVCM